MADVRQRLATLLEQRGAPGAQYLVVRDGVPLLELSHGLADARYAAPVTPTATFNAYSITKPFTTAAVLALTKVGALDLDEPIGRAFGVASLADYGSVRETVLHRAGLRNPYPLCWVHRADAHRDFDEAAFIRARMDALTGTRRRRAPSGYSNLGYLLLGLAVERAWRNGSFVEAMRALVLDPLGAAAGDCLGFTIGKPDEHAHGHLWRHGWIDLALGLLVGDPNRPDLRRLCISRVCPDLSERHRRVRMMLSQSGPPSTQDAGHDRRAPNAEPPADGLAARRTAPVRATGECRLRRAGGSGAGGFARAPGGTRIRGW
jgi:hypothetical protein